MPLRLGGNYWIRYKEAFIFDMKPIEKYQQKFIELLKEAEEELGGDLSVEVFSKTITGNWINATRSPSSLKEHKCSISARYYASK